MPETSATQTTDRPATDTPKPTTIALDAMGGDFGPGVVVPAAALAMAAHAGELRFIFFGDRAKIDPLLAVRPQLAAVSEVVHTDRTIANGEKPSVALRTGKESSMRLAIEAVSENRAHGVVSAGNTGALMAFAKLVLRCLPGIERPALASVMPARKGQTVVLDLGANVQCDAPLLVQFAVLGSVYARTVKSIHNPTVALLNVGTEDMKGNEQVREAAAILSKIRFPGQFKGFVEGNDIPEGTVDVVVTDGFTGNIALKVAEGVASLMSSFLKTALRSTPLAVLGAVLASGALKRLKSRMDPRHYNGGMFLGLNGICVKSHGGMDDYGFSRAILVAVDLVENGYNRRVADEIAQVMRQEDALAAVAAEAAGGAQA